LKIYRIEVEKLEYIVYIVQQSVLVANNWFKVRRCKFYIWNICGVTDADHSIKYMLYIYVVCENQIYVNFVFNFHIQHCGVPWLLIIKHTVHSLY